MATTSVSSSLSSKPTSILRRNGNERSNSQTSVSFKASLDKFCQPNRNHDSDDMYDSDGQEHSIVQPNDRLKEDRINEREIDKIDPEGFQGEEKHSHDLSLKKEAGVLDYPVEAFNMDEEREGGEGFFDGDTYVFRREKKEQDAWLDGLDEKDTIALPSQPPELSTDDATDERTKEETCGDLAKLLMPGESVLSALKRHGEILKKEKKRKVIEKSSRDYIVKDDKPNANKSVSAAGLMVAQISDMADQLFTRGDLEAYERNRSDLLKMAGIQDDGSSKKRSYFEISQDKEVKREQSSTTGKKFQWEYRGNEDNKVHGPFTTEQMIHWISKGYFVKEQAVDTRKIIKESAKDETTDDADDLISDLLEDDDEQKSDNEEEWVKSDKIDFSLYL